MATKRVFSIMLIVIMVLTYLTSCKVNGERNNSIIRCLKKNNISMKGIDSIFITDSLVVPSLGVNLYKLGYIEGEFKGYFERITILYFNQNNRSYFLIDESSDFLQVELDYQTKGYYGGVKRYGKEINGINIFLQESNVDELKVAAFNSILKFHYGDSDLEVLNPKTTIKPFIEDYLDKEKHKLENNNYKIILEKQFYNQLDSLLNMCNKDNMLFSQVKFSTETNNLYFYFVKRTTHKRLKVEKVGISPFISLLDSSIKGE